MCLFMVVPFAEVALAGLARLIFNSFMRLMLSDKLDAATLRTVVLVALLLSGLSLRWFVWRKLAISLCFVNLQPEPRAWAISSAL